MNKILENELIYNLEKNPKVILSLTNNKMVFNLTLMAISTNEECLTTFH